MTKHNAILSSTMHNDQYEIRKKWHIFSYKILTFKPITHRLPDLHTSTSERVGNSMPLSAGMFSKSSSENNGNNHRAFFVPKTYKR